MTEKTDRRPLTIVHTDFHRGWGGQINQVVTSCVGLKERGHRVILAVPRGGRPAQRAKELGLELFDEVRFRAAGHVADLWHDVWALRGLLREVDADIVHSHGSQDTWAVALGNKVLPGGPRVPHLLTRHNTKRVRDSLANRWLIGSLLDRLIVVADAVIDRYQPLIDRGLLERARIPVLPSPLRPDVRAAQAPDRTRLKQELGLDPSTPVCGTIARLVPDKGQLDLLRAVDRLLEQGADLHLVLAGDGDDEAMLKEFARGSERLASRVHFLGYREDVVMVTAGLDIAVLPAVDCDASSGMIKEALALGVPVVATEIGAAREICGDGRFGMIVPPRDPSSLSAAIGAMLRELPRWREAALQGAEEIRRQYTVERLVLGLEQVYREHCE